MSNYYHRDNEGNWFVKHGRNDYMPVEFSGSMEVAYQMGRIAGVAKLTEELDEDIMSVGDTQIREVSPAHLPG